MNDNEQNAGIKSNDSVEVKHLSAKGWIAVEDRLPYLDVNVLMYHEIETINEGIYPYLEIGYLTCPREEEKHIELAWMDKEHNRLTSPLHWMLLPKPPIER